MRRLDSNNKRCVGKIHRMIAVASHQLEARLSEDGPACLRDKPPWAALPPLSRHDERGIQEV
jgi:hypothetical protein